MLNNASRNSELGRPSNTCNSSRSTTKNEIIELCHFFGSHCAQQTPLQNLWAPYNCSRLKHVTVSCGNQHIVRPGETVKEKMQALIRSTRNSVQGSKHRFVCKANNSFRPIAESRSISQAQLNSTRAHNCLAYIALRNIGVCTQPTLIGAKRFWGMGIQQRWPQSLFQTPTPL